MSLRNRVRNTALILVFTLPLAFVAHAGEVTEYGESLTVEKATPIAKILADPEAWVGKKVRIEGGVLDVCPMKGCWIEVGDEEKSLKVKVDDGVIIFPSDAKGHLAVAEGTVEAIEMTRERYVGWLAHLAEEKGETFDEASADIGEGPYKIFQIRGSGASLTSK